MDREQLLHDLRRDEGWSPHLYFDTEGYQTIGYGFLVDDRRGGGLPREVGDYWLGLLVDRKTAQLKSALPWIVDRPEPVQRALGNLSYQIGVSGLLRFRKTLALLEQRKYPEAADEALNSRWAQQTPNRACRVTDLIRTARN